MARQLRTIAQEVTYHCYSSCHDNQKFLQSSLGEHLFFEAIQMCQEKYKFEVSGTEIVDDHVHFVIRTLEDGETISRIMQYIKARIGQKYNKIMNRRGAFWNGRFKCTIVEESNNPLFY